jgi:hypothetical protein
MLSSAADSSCKIEDAKTFWGWAPTKDKIFAASVTPTPGIKHQLVQKQTAAPNSVQPMNRLPACIATIHLPFLDPTVGVAPKLSAITHRYFSKVAICDGWPRDPRYQGSSIFHGVASSG